MRKLTTLLTTALLLAASSCQQELDVPRTADGEGQKVKITFAAKFPEGDPESKVAFGNGEEPQLTWTGDETAMLIFGISGTNNSNNPTIPSVSPGIFSGEVTIPSGFEITDLRAVVVPGDNGANFRGDHSSDKDRVRMYVPYSQTQAENGVFNPTYIPLFAEIQSTDLIDEGNSTYSLPSLQLKSASDMVQFTIYGAHADQEKGEVFKSIRLDANDRLANRGEYNLGTGQNKSNLSGSNGDSYASVSLSEALTIADKTSENGLKVYLNVVLSGSRTVEKVTLRTDKATYTKTISYGLSQDNLNYLKVYPININLSNGYTRSSFIKYSTDGGQTWLEELPTTFTTLAVKSEEGATLSEETLERIKAAMANQSAPVDLDLRKSTYQTTVFPAVFNGTADEKSDMVKSIKFPYNVTEIAENAFAYCSSLESVDLTGITTLNTKAFYFSGLKTLDVPKTVTAIKGYLTFGCCANLTEIYYDSPSGQYKDEDNNRINHATFAYVNNMTDGNQNPDDRETDSSTYPELHPAEPSCVVTIGPNVTHLARRMFAFNDNIAKIIFQGTPSSIGNYAFNYIRNVYLVDCRMMSSPISGYANDTYQKKLGMSAKAAGKELKILVPAGTSDAFAEKYPFKWMVANGWKLVEEDVEATTLENVRIGTYNVRIQTSNDGDNNWPTRITYFLQSVEALDMDIFGLQEAQKYHQADLEEKIGDIYGFEWFCPNKGSSKESIGIAYKKSDWTLTSRKTFWINPDDPTVQKAYDYSSSYKSYFYRGAICGTLIHKKTGTKLFFMCTHGCLGNEQNVASAFLYPQQEALYNPTGLPSFFVGDFNAKPELESSVSYREYWNDTFLSIDESLRSGCEYTYNGFKKPEGSSRIDYVYYRGAGVTPTAYKCDNTLYDGHYPSDHWPVYGDFTLAPADSSTDSSTDSTTEGSTE